MNSDTHNRSADGPDPELVELPAPRRPFRKLTLVTLGTTTVVAASMVAGLAGDLGYALSRGQAAEIGALSALHPRPEQRNTWVRADGELAAIGGVRFERPLEADSFRLAPVQGNPQLWIQIRVPSGYENEYFVAPTVFSGRLVPLSALGLRYQTLSVAADDAGWKPGHLASNAWLLIDGETPINTRWVIGLIGLFLGFAAFSTWALFSLLRPVGGLRGSRTEPAE